MLDRVGLEAILIGNASALMHGAPVMTEDINFFVRDTPLNRKKLSRLSVLVGPGAALRRLGDATEVVRLLGAALPIDFIFGMGGGLRFESVKSRSTPLLPGVRRVWLASLRDVIASKEAANRPKDRAILGQLRATLDVQSRLNEELAPDRSSQAGEPEARYRTRAPRSNRIRRSRRSRR